MRSQHLVTFGGRAASGAGGAGPGPAGLPLGCVTLGEPLTLEDRPEGNSTYDHSKHDTKGWEPRGQGTRAQEQQTSALSTASFISTCSDRRSPRQRALPGTHSSPRPRVCWHRSQAGCWGGSVHLTSAFNFWKSWH